MNDIIPAVLTIAGSDSGGGAGIQADLRTFSAFEVYGCSVITAVTSQNPFEVRKVDILPLETVRTQLESVLDVFPVRFAKTGMLADRKTVECVADIAEKYDLNLIVDPVMVSTSGTKLLEDSAISAMTELLFPQALWITPNIPEAELLAERKLQTPADLADTALYLYQKFKCNVLLKNATEKGGKSADISVINQTAYTLAMPRVEDLSQYAEHGSGCTLASGITAMLAAGCDWPDALRAAKAHVYGALCETAHVGKDIDAMYPPLEDYSKLVSLSRIQTSKPTCKGSGA